MGRNNVARSGQVLSCWNTLANPSPSFPDLGRRSWKEGNVSLGLAKYMLLASHNPVVPVQRDQLRCHFLRAIWTCVVDNDYFVLETT